MVIGIAVLRLQYLFLKSIFKMKVLVGIFRLISLSYIFIFCSCSYDHSSSKDDISLLESAVLVIEDNPEQALKYLQAVNTSQLSEADYYFYVLLEVRASEKVGKMIASYEYSVIQAKDYFTNLKDAEKAAFACFEAARIYEVQDNRTKALYYYMQADEWAERIGYQLPFFPASIIPYNIAVINCHNREYQTAIDYINKSISLYSIKKVNFKNKLYAQELKGICFRYMELLDSALFCYQAAISIANANDDIASKHRLSYALLNLGSKEDVEIIEAASHFLLHRGVAQDSITKGSLHILLAQAYCNLNKVEHADRHIELASNLLQNAEEYIKLSLFKTISSIKEKQKDKSRAVYYQSRHDSIFNRIEYIRKQQEGDLHKELQVQLAQKEGELAAATLTMKGYMRVDYVQKKNSWRSIYLILIISLLSITSISYFKIKSNRKFLRKIASEDIKLIISRKSYLEQIKDCNDSSKVGEITDDLSNINSMSAILDKCYGSLYYKLKKAYPSLNNKELLICWFKSAKVANDTEIQTLSGLTAHDYVKATKSIKEKIVKTNKRSIINSLFKE